MSEECRRDFGLTLWRCRYAACACRVCAALAPEPGLPASELLREALVAATLASSMFAHVQLPKG